MSFLPLSSLLSSLENVPIAPSVAFHARAPDAPQGEAGRDEGDPDKRPPISVGHEIAASAPSAGNSGRARVDIAADEGDTGAGGNGSTENVDTATAVKNEDPDTEMKATPVAVAPVKTEEDEEKPPSIQAPVA